MALFTAPTSDSNARALVQCDITVISENQAANQSTVRITGRVSDNSTNFGGNSVSSTWNVVLNGVQRGSGSIAYDFTGNSGRTYTFYTGDFVVGHATNGTGSVSGSAYWAGNDGLTGSATASGSIGLTDFNFTPVWQSISVPTPAIRNAAYSGQVVASYTASYSLISGPMPAGLTFNSNGTITGTPTTLGSYPITFRATGTNEGSVDATRTIVVNPPLPVFSDSTIAAIAIRGVPYSDSVSASDTSSYSIASSSLPTGLNFNTSTGAISGTGTETFQTRAPVFRATNVTGSTDTPALSIVVNPPAPVFSDSTVLGTASIGSPYSDQVVASDAASYSVFSGTLPAGLSLNTSTGVISGTPTTAGDSTFVIRATNVTGNTNTPSRTITVISPVRVWTGSDFSVGQLNVWDGSDFTIGVMKVWDGTTWVSAK